MLSGPEVVFWDWSGVLAHNSESLVDAVTVHLLNDAMRAADINAPQFDINTFNAQYSGASFNVVYTMAQDMLRDHDASLTLPPQSELNAIRAARTNDVLAEQAMPAADTNLTLMALERAGLRQCVVSERAYAQILPCLAKIPNYDFGGLFQDGGRVFSETDAMDHVFGAQRITPGPDVALFAAIAMDIYDDRATKSIAVEDDVSGVERWANLGVPVIGYTGGTHIADKVKHADMLKAKGAMAVYDTMADIGRAIITMRQPVIAPSIAPAPKP